MLAMGYRRVLRVLAAEEEDQIGTVRQGGWSSWYGPWCILNPHSSTLATAAIPTGARCVVIVRRHLDFKLADEKPMFAEPVHSIWSLCVQCKISGNPNEENTNLRALLLEHGNPSPIRGQLTDNSRTSSVYAGTLPMVFSARPIFQIRTAWARSYQHKMN